MVREIAESYFLSLNPIAERITLDISSIKAAYETLWVGLSRSEQEKIINDAIIYPNLKLKYSADCDDFKTRSTCKFSCGDKVICDEQTGSSWRDEHSAPFSWKSRSLLSLCESSKCVPPLASTEKTYFRKFSNVSTIPDTAEPDTKESQPTTSTFGNFTNSLCSKLKAFTLDDNKFFISKVKGGAVERLQNTLRFMTGKSNSSSNGENHRLVVHSQALIVPKADMNKAIGFTVAVKELNGCTERTYDEQEDVPATMPMLTKTSRGSMTEDDSILENEAMEFDQRERIEDVIVTKTGFDFLDDW